MDNLKNGLTHGLNGLRLTVERDGGSAVIQEMPRTSDKNNNEHKTNTCSITSDVTSAANDSCSMSAEYSVPAADNVPSDSGCGPASPTSTNMHRQVKRRSTVPKGFVTLAVYVCFSRSHLTMLWTIGPLLLNEGDYSGIKSKDC